MQRSELEAVVGKKKDITNAEVLCRMCRHLYLLRVRLLVQRHLPRLAATFQTDEINRL
jgi:hypothetical protein